MGRVSQPECYPLLQTIPAGGHDKKGLKNGAGLVFPSTARRLLPGWSTDVGSRMDCHQLQGTVGARASVIDCAGWASPPRPLITEEIVPYLPVAPEEWAQQQFDECELGDRRRNKTLVKIGAHMAARPDGSTPVQTENWATCKAAYRLFNEPDVTFGNITRPHYRRTRAQSDGPVKLLISDTTELDFGIHRQIEGLAPTGNGGGWGFYVHSCLMVDPVTGVVDGLAGQRLFYRPIWKGKKPHRNTRRRAPHRQSSLWGDVMDDAGSPPPGVRWIHVCDRAADDFEVFCRARTNNCDFIIRASHLSRRLSWNRDDRRTVAQYVQSLAPQCTVDVAVRASPRRQARTARCEVRFGPLEIPPPLVISPWIRAQASREPFRMWVIEIREIAPPTDADPLRWVLYVSLPVISVEDALQMIDYYRRRPTIEDFHKGLKTGCSVEQRQYRTAGALERVAAVSSLLAVRLLQIKTLAKQDPDLPALKVVPVAWISTLRELRPRLKQQQTPIGVRDFLRALAGLGGHLGRKSDGEPGWITLWRGLEKLLLMQRGIDLAERRRRRSG